MTSGEVIAALFVFFIICVMVDFRRDRPEIIASDGRRPTPAAPTPPRRDATTSRPAWLEIADQGCVLELSRTEETSPQPAFAPDRHEVPLPRVEPKIDQSPRSAAGHAPPAPHTPQLEPRHTLPGNRKLAIGAACIVATWLILR